MWPAVQGGRDFPPSLLLQILGVKIITTAVCKGSGLVGGIYAPSIFMGVRIAVSYSRAAGCHLQRQSHLLMRGLL